MNFCVQYFSNYLHAIAESFTFTEVFPNLWSWYFHTGVCLYTQSITVKTSLQVAVTDVIAQVHGACRAAEEDKLFVNHCLSFVFGGMNQN